MEGHSAPLDTQTASGQEGMGPATPRGGPEAQVPPAAAPEASTAGRALASTLAATLPADQMEVLLNLIRQDEERRPGAAPATTAPLAAGNPTPLPPNVCDRDVGPDTIPDTFRARTLHHPCPLKMEYVETSKFVQLLPNLKTKPTTP